MNKRGRPPKKVLDFTKEKQTNEIVIIANEPIYMNKIFLEVGKEYKVTANELKTLKENKLKIEVK